ncbi:MAG TPA: methyltransferase domain-containing protein [Chitinophagaceae bacterium]|nr:methyltransferase domain-containing protein [Chitinophagaceae bacterium]
MRIHSYLKSAETLLALYDGSYPFAGWLKQFFAANKKYGSKDRKHISNLCYNYFRLGRAFATYSVEEKLLIGQFLTSNTTNIFLEEERSEWNELTTRSIPGKLDFLNKPGEWEQIFPWLENLSKEINPKAFALSHLSQPHLYLRLRPSKKESAKLKLRNAQIVFKELDDNCLQLPNGTKLDEIINIDEDAVIQDVSSQKVLQPIKDHLSALTKKINVWDCCAASGGKSILAYDTIPNIFLTVSDIRTSILFNLQKRFERAGIKKYKSFVADLSHSPLTIHHSPFDLIICDAPCTGSGTWSRTPEQLYFFKEEKIEYYASLQKKITVNATKSLKQGGYFLYITCSVFRKENEEVVECLQQNTSLQLKSMRYFKGYEVRADTLFTALFTL